MSGLVFASIAERTGALVILDAGRRLYVGISHDRTYWHVVQPTAPGGELTCTCAGAHFHGRCYRVLEADAFEAGSVEQLRAPAWMRDFDAPFGAGESVEASRG
jgi:hypothetical protein